MKEEIAMAWAERLDNLAEFQGTGKLRVKRNKEYSQYCCLGVLSEMAVEAEVINPPYEVRNTSYGTVYRYGPLGETGSLCREVQDWAGMFTPDGAAGTDNLIVFNDNGWSFPKIAAFIRENWRRL